MSSKLRTVSWVLLALVGALVLLTALASTHLAYWGLYPVGGVSIDEMPSDRGRMSDDLPPITWHLHPPTLKPLLDRLGYRGKLEIPVSAAPAW